MPYPETRPTTRPSRSVGEVLREWRQRRRMSQLDLALEAEISQRHLSFLESGRSLPSREMLLHLAERLRCRCASATRCCWRPAMRRSMPSAGSTTRR